MSERTEARTQPLPNIVKAEGEEPLFREGDTVRIANRSPIGHFRAPNYIRGKRGRVELVVKRRQSTTKTKVSVETRDKSATITAWRFQCLSCGWTTKAPHRMGFGSKSLRLGWKGSER
jgi:Nitrile hydratase beta subunit